VKSATLVAAPFFYTSLTAMSHKDWLSRRQRQKQQLNVRIRWGNTGVSKLTENGIRKCCTTEKLSIRETADATGYSASQVCHIQGLYK
jgi:hypothetical protein